MKNCSAGCGVEVEGFLVVDKPRGWTSHDVVAWARRALKARKVGHTGTLDPLATGVLVLALGQATKFIPFLDEGEKEYIVKLRLGASTDTDDAEGKLIEQKEVPEDLSQWKFEDACRRFTGKVLQRPPLFSALHHRGRRLYELARKGELVEVSPRRISINSIEILDFCPPSVRLRVACSRGTYVRALVRDIGEALRCGAYVEDLRRTRSGPFREEKALALEEVEQLASDGQLPVIPIGEALGLSRVRLGAEETMRFIHGGEVSCPGTGKVTVYAEDGAFLGVGNGEGGRVRPLRVMSL